MLLSPCALFHFLLPCVPNPLLQGHGVTLLTSLGLASFEDSDSKWVMF